jgi:glycosyltransferase involved in cell wall biosynthesis
MSNRHIAIICPSLDGGGAVASVALHQARELAKAFRVTLLSDGLPERELQGVGHHLLHPLSFRVLRRFAHVPREISFALAAKSAVAKLHSSCPVDMVICHGHASAAIAARPLRRRLRMCYALVTHGDIFDRPKGTYDRRLTYFYQRVTPPAYRDADLVIALSPHMSACALRGGASADSIVMIPNGIDPADIGLCETAGPAAAQPAAQGRMELLYVGRLSVEKGVDILLRAVSVLQRDAISFRLRVAGSGPQGAPLRELAAQLGLGECVEFLGPVPRSQLGPLYRASTVVCVPSRSDPLPTVVLEAMCAGVAIAGSQAGGIPYLVTEGVTGLLCSTQDPGALAENLKRLAHETGRAHRMGAAGRERAVSEFNWPNIGQMLARAINGAVDKRAAST